MNLDQGLLFALLAGLFILFIWGRWRYDLVAFAALVVAVAIGVVPAEGAFSGFGHPATIIIALVLIVSRGLTNAGVVELVASRVVDASRPLAAHIGTMAGVTAVMSAVMNNVAALALLMPVDLQASAKAGRSPAITLMPLSFASILGGLVTLIGTPPNIIIASFREQEFGTPFGMFDFTPVGGLCAIAGVLFVTLVGWRLVPAARAKVDAGKELKALEEFITELKVPKDANIVSKQVRELDDAAEENDVQVLGLVRRGRRLPGLARRETVSADDILVVEGGPEGIEAFAGAVGLGYVEREEDEDDVLKSRDLEMREAVVPPGAFAEGRMVGSLPMLRRHGVTLLGISRQGQRFRERLRRVDLRAGDILLLFGRGENISEVIQQLGSLPLAERGLQVLQRRLAGAAAGIFAAAILIASFGLLSLPIALGAVVVLYVVFGIVPLRELYGSIEWSVIVLLGSLIPIAGALETSGGTGLIAGGLVAVSEGYAAWVVLTLLLVVTMSLSDVMNNTATAVIAAPVTVEMAARLGVNGDAFLMAVAVGASCAFLTPIGHKNNTLIMGPGGYRFSDYWRMGLPLELLIVLVAVPAILVFWPL